MSAADGRLQGDDYIWPLSTLRDTLINPGATLPSAKLRSIFTYHIDRLRTPWRRAKSGSKDGPNVFSQPTVSPAPGVNIDIDEASRGLASKLAEAAGIAGADACLLVKSYMVYVHDGVEPVELDQLLVWYTEECLALAQIVLEVLYLSKEPEGSEWVQLAVDIKAEMIPDAEDYLEGLFKGWAGLAQQGLNDVQRSGHALFWATHSLRLQSIILDILFLVLYEIPDRSVLIAQGLIRGFMMSNFATNQANREIWESDAEALRLSCRIRDLALIIVVESLGLTAIVTPGEDGASGELHKSRDSIVSLHLFINDYTSSLAPSPDAPRESGIPSTFPFTPTPIVSLAWAIFLNSLPPERTPPTPGPEGQPSQQMASRALAPHSALFPWLEAILTGPLHTGSSSDRSETFRRKVIKDLLVGLADFDQFSMISDRSGLYRIWDILFATGSPSTSLSLSADYWLADYPSLPRRVLLDHSGFPHNPTLLPYILSTLSGISSEDSTEASLFDVRPVEMVAEYFSHLATKIIPTDPGWYRFLRKDDEGRMLVQAARDIVLPGGAVIAVGQTGSVLRTEGDRQIVAWETQMPAWTILVEILKAALGLRDMAQRDPPVSDTSVSLSVADLTLTGGSGEVLSAGLRLLSCVLRPVGGLSDGVLALIQPTHGHPVYTILEIVITALQQIANDVSSDATAGILSLDIFVSLLHLHPSHVFSVLRTTNFFGVPGRKRGLAYHLVHLDSSRGIHDITSSLLRMVTAMVTSSFVSQSDDGSIRAAVHETFADIWSMFGGWRYADSTKKHVLAIRICDLYQTILAHPVEADGITPTPAAQAAVEVFITSASTVTYRPLIELLTQGPSIAQRLVTARQPFEAAIVTQSVQAAIHLLSALFRIASKAGISAVSLPFSIFTTTSIVDGEKISLVDALARSATSPGIQVGTRIRLLKLIRTYLESTALDPRKASLAGLLRDVDSTCSQIATFANEDASTELRCASWDLLASIISTQPGCAPACIGSGSTPNLPLESAMAQIVAGDLGDTPETLSSLLAFCNAALISPSATTSIPTLRSKQEFWKAVFEIATRPVAIPPSFQLSIHAPDFASRITAYAYATQARANATALLATKVRLLGEAEGDEKSHALDLVLGAWRSGERLSDLVGAAMKSSCEPELQAREMKRLEVAGISLEKYRTVKMACERDFGMGYLYDGNVQARDADNQPIVNLGIDTLNLNWSMLEADIALTRAFRDLAEGLAEWTDGDALAAKAAMRAAVIAGEAASEEGRSGDVLLSVQTERLAILSLLLETALAQDVEVDNAQLVTICTQIRAIVDSSQFPPISSMRHPTLPSIHRPTLNILQSLFTRLSSLPMTTPIEYTVEVGGSFILEAADLALDTVSRGTGAPSDLALTIPPLCAMIALDTTIWFDRLATSNLIMRSLELITRIRIVSDNVPAYVPSILLLHLALANHPRAAEKLATSGLLASYSNNVIATQAEYGKITPELGDYSVHSTWCGMILVIKTILSSLPQIANFVRSDVIPFIRLTTLQTTRSMSWDADSPLSLPAIQEMVTTVELFHAISSSVGSDISLLCDFSSAVLPLLVSIRFALNHPRVLSTQMAPSTEEEQFQLQKEIAIIESQQAAVLIDFGKTPALARRTAELIGTARAIFLTLIGFSGAWDIISGLSDVDEGYIIYSDDEASSTSTDPVGIINDFQAIASTLSEQVSATTDEGTALLRVCHQLAEAGSLLSASQILLRRATLPAQSNDDMGMRDEEKKPGGGGGRMSLSKGSERDRAEGLLRELEGDWRAIISGDGAVGDRALAGKLSDVVDKAFDDAEDM